MHYALCDRHDHSVGHPAGYSQEVVDSPAKSSRVQRTVQMLQAMQSCSGAQVSGILQRSRLRAGAKPVRVWALNDHHFQSMSQ